MKIRWSLKQLLPFTYYSVYRSNNERYFHVWKMWFGRCYNQVKFSATVTGGGK